MLCILEQTIAPRTVEGRLCKEEVERWPGEGQAWCSAVFYALRKTDHGLEYGRGRSTLWFAKRTEWASAQCCSTSRQRFSLGFVLIRQPMQKLEGD
jgi:hypothetical protein